jgi:prepilin-type N-terminal cleavage/methylation domain-containing protein
MKSISNTKTGFTIVELLIVIVVIAVLASISIVAYTGIQYFQFANGKAVEMWSFMDHERLKRQLAPVAKPGEAGPAKTPPAK